MSARGLALDQVPGSPGFGVLERRLHHVLVVLLQSAGDSNFAPACDWQAGQSGRTVLVAEVGNFLAVGAEDVHVGGTMPGGQRWAEGWLDLPERPVLANWPGPPAPAVR